MLKLALSQGFPILHGLLHSNLWCGQSTTSLYCQASLPRCASTHSQVVWASGILLLPAQLPGTHWVMICVIGRLALRVSDVCLKRGCFQSTSTYSALEVSHSRLTYLLTYMTSCCIITVCRCLYQLRRRWSRIHLRSAYQTDPVVKNTALWAEPV